MFPRRAVRFAQIADTGIVPGSGVGNSRQALNREALGVPVIAVGVPTVVDAATLTLDLAARSGVSPDPAAFGDAGGMIVTPREIDSIIQDAAGIIASGINRALQPRLSDAEIAAMMD